MIDHITKFTNGNKYILMVFYKSGRVVRYTEQDNLPSTVLDLCLNGTCETRYTKTGKVEYFRKQGG